MTDQEPEAPEARIINRVKTVVLLCKALGVDAARASSITITLDSGTPRFVVEYFLDSKTTETLAACLHAVKGDMERADKATAA